MYVHICTCNQDVEAGYAHNCSTIEFLKFIPTVTCRSPRDAISHDPPIKGIFIFT